MFRHHFSTSLSGLCLALLLTWGAVRALSQTTQFTYQGLLNDGGSPANGSYDLQFRLFDAVVGGTQIGSTLLREDVAVSNGLFKVTLDFGAAAFPGADRFLEIGVRPGASTGAFTTLAPRQQLTGTPYAIRSLSAASADAASDAAQLGGVAAGQYVLTSDARLADARPPTPGSANYIQNTAMQQASSQFNISGTGTADIFNATTQYNLGGAGILSAAGTNNLFTGALAGSANTSGNANAFFGASAGSSNTGGSTNAFFGAFAGSGNTNGTNNAFFGASAGSANTTGNNNSFFGRWAGLFNTTGIDNSFFGRETGRANTTGLFNSFFGSAAGRSNTTGGSNSSFGYETGLNNTTGSRNSFFGSAAGRFNTGGSGNSFFGASAGDTNTSENNNTFIGADSDGQAGITNATAIGYRAQVTQSNSLVLGSISGVNGATDSTNVGIGTTNPAERLAVVGNGLFTGNLTVNGTISGNGSAVTNLSASNINSGTLPTGRGGTGLGAAGAAGNYLRSDGAVWASSALQAADLPSGSASYIQNSAMQQAASQFNISGMGTASIFNAMAQYNLGGDRVLSVAGTNNLFAGVFTGSSNTIGISNSFFGRDAGRSNTEGNYNSFFGYEAGELNTDGSNNSFFGKEAGYDNTTGDYNAFFGMGAGRGNTSENNNTFIGAHSKGTAGITYATAVGHRAQVTQSNSLVLGSINGVNSSSVDTNVGIGTTAPANRLHVVASLNAIATPPGHVALIENTSTGNSPDVLALKIGRTTNPDPANNFITFFNGNDASVGSIEGNSAGGVVLAGPGNDYAEWLPRLDPAETIQPGEVVGVFDGRISKATQRAAQVLVVSSSPIVAGNDPGAQHRATHALVAFIGQVGVRVRGAVQAGDFIVPSGQEDGVGMAVAPGRITAEQFAQVVGQAWEAAADPGIKQVRVAVGLIRSDPTVQRLVVQNQQQAAQLDLLHEKLAALEARFSASERKIQRPAAHNSGKLQQPVLPHQQREQQREEIEALKRLVCLTHSQAAACQPQKPPR